MEEMIVGKKDVITGIVVTILNLILLFYLILEKNIVLIILLLIIIGIRLSKIYDYYKKMINSKEK